MPALLCVNKDSFLYISNKSLRTFPLSHNAVFLTYLDYFIKCLMKTKYMETMACISLFYIYFFM